MFPEKKTLKVPVEFLHSSPHTKRRSLCLTNEMLLSGIQSEGKEKPASFSPSPAAPCLLLLHSFNVLFPVICSISEPGAESSKRQNFSPDKTAGRLARNNWYSVLQVRYSVLTELSEWEEIDVQSILTIMKKKALFVSCLVIRKRFVMLVMTWSLLS